MPDLSGIRRSNLKLQSNELILFLATKYFLRPWAVETAAAETAAAETAAAEPKLLGAVVEPHPFGGVRFLKIKYKIGMCFKWSSRNRMAFWTVL